MALEDDPDHKDRRPPAAKRVSALRGLAARAAEAREQEAKTAAPEPERRNRPSLVRSMMKNIEDTPPREDGERKKPRVPPHPARRPRRTRAKIPESPELTGAFENAPDDRAQRARRAAERVRQRATPETVPEPEPEPEVAPPQRGHFVPKPLREAGTRPFAGFEWDIASRYLRARRKEGFISVIAGFSLVGIGLGVAVLIIVMAVMTGFRETLIEQIVGVDAHINVTSQNAEFTDYDTLAVAVRQVDGVVNAAPYIEGQVLASSATGHSGVIIHGMRREDLAKLKVVTDPEASAGSLDRYAGDGGIAMGDGVARRLGLRLGDSVNLVSPEGDLTPFGTMPRSKSYPVVYIFKLGLAQYDGARVYMPLREAQLYFNKKGRVDALSVRVDDPSDVDDYRQPIAQAARQSVGLYTWKDLQGSLIKALDVERNVMFLILTMIILVAALNIISGLVMLVKDKARDVAILRTMGMSRGAVLRVFFICGATIGVIGAVAGTILGVLFCLNIAPIQRAVESVVGPVFPSEVYGLSGLPAVLETSDVVFTLTMALFLAFAATLYPAWKAAKLDPVEALRYE